MLEEIIIFLIVYAILVLTDLVPVYKSKDKKSIVICTAMFALAFILQVMFALGVELPSPNAALKSLITMITG